jgi:dimethylglycine dehydrogenase
MNDMRTDVDVAIIGGGVTGVSVLFHLAKMGMTNVVLIERAELTAGSTWHAAGVIHTVNSDPNIARMQSYTLDLYDEIEALSGVPCGLHRPGGIYLASTPERLDYLRLERAKARYMGMDADFISMDEVKELNPLIDTDEFLGALFEPADGHVDPSGVTNAYAQSAIHYGAQIQRNNPVHDLTQRPDGSWDVHTEHGVIRAGIVVNAAGLWARELGRMVGVELPLLPMEHQFVITEELPEIIDHGREIAVTIDYEGNAYTRQEGNSLLIGTYEQAGKPWSPDTTPLDFGMRLLTPDLDRFVDRIEIAQERMPVLASAGIARVVNGPFTFAPDGNPLIGPVPGLRNYWTACAVMAGFCQAGGVGLCLAQWIIDGEPDMDVYAMDVGRFGSYATKDYTYLKSQENYRRRFMITYPNEELPEARPWRTTPSYDALTNQNAVWGASFGLEHALWFAPEGDEPYETPTYRRSNAFGTVAAEVRAVREGVGVLEIANFAKYEVSGPGAAEYLDGIVANHLPKVGRLALTPILTPAGRLAADLTVGRLADDRFVLFGSGSMPAITMRLFEQHLPETGVTVTDRSNDLMGWSIAGPDARNLLERLTDADVSNHGLRFRDLREMTVGGVPVIVARLSFTGELGYELYCTEEHHEALRVAIMEAGADLDVTPFGGRAFMSMRFEKGFGVWNLEFRPDFTPAEAGMSPFVKVDKAADFIGKAAAAAELETGPANRLVTLVLDVDDADAIHDEPVFHDGGCVGFVTSGGYAHYVEASMALAYVPAHLADAYDDTFEVEILGHLRPARIAPEPLYDPAGERMRS